MIIKPMLIIWDNIIITVAWKKFKAQNTGRYRVKLTVGKWRMRRNKDLARGLNNNDDDVYL